MKYVKNYDNNTVCVMDTDSNTESEYLIEDLYELCKETGNIVYGFYINEYSEPKVKCALTLNINLTAKYVISKLNNIEDLSERRKSIESLAFYFADASLYSILVLILDGKSVLAVKTDKDTWNVNGKELSSCGLSRLLVVQYLNFNSTSFQLIVG